MGETALIFLHLLLGLLIRLLICLVKEVIVNVLLSSSTRASVSLTSRAIRAASIHVVHSQSQLHLLILKYLLGFNEVVQVFHQDLDTLLRSLEEISEIQHEIIKESDIIESQAEADAVEMIFHNLLVMCEQRI